tara:strand:- start:791 stop:1102 length:312 start_codon:yes stop_codon:yes gene_type:complete
MQPRELLLIPYKAMVEYIVRKGTTIELTLLVYGLRRVVIHGDRSSGDAIAVAFTAGQVETLDSLLFCDNKMVGSVVTSMWSGGTVVKETLIDSYKWCIKDGRF